MRFKFISLFALVVLVVGCTLFAKEQANYYENAKDIRNLKRDDNYSNADSGLHHQNSLWNLN